MELLIYTIIIYWYIYHNCFTIQLVTSAKHFFLSTVFSSAVPDTLHVVYFVVAAPAKNGQRLLLGHSRETRTAKLPLAREEAGASPRTRAASRARGTEITGRVPSVLDSLAARSACRYLAGARLD